MPLFFILYFYLLFRLSPNSMKYYDSNYPGQDSESNSNALNLDFHCAISQILQNLENIRTSHKQVLQMWNHKKIKLDQCFQLRLFEQDCEKVIT